MATRFVKITDDDVEILIEREENENTRKKDENYTERSSANMKHLLHLKWNPFNEVTKICRLSRLQRCFTVIT